ncbi:hypothetical protein COB18_03110 [Candidatus Kaiserbacteria bacterium]|nr:MAG: hypothetical protein COB18_03110 [Candidatus Kaiserbacteria bacterium]
MDTEAANVLTEIESILGELDLKESVDTNDVQEAIAKLKKVTGDITLQKEIERGIQTLEEFYK